MDLDQLRELVPDARVHQREEHVELVVPGVYRAFAAWFPKGKQAGLHVRSLVPKAVKSLGFRGGDHNWVYIADPKDVKALLVEAQRLATMRGGGRASVAVELYKPFAKGVELISRRPPYLHAGGPRAKVLSGEGGVAVALAKACKDRMAHTATADDKKLIRAIAGKFGNVRNEVWWPLANAAGYKTPKQMREIEDAESAALQCARAELGAAHAGSQSCLPYVTKAIVRAMRELEDDDAEEAAAFAIVLDDLILTHELRAAHEKLLKQKPPKFDRVLWRHGDAKQFPAWWIARIDSDTYGFLGKLGGKWGWHVSDRDNTLATVPDELLDSAVEMVLARSQ